MFPRIRHTHMHTGGCGEGGGGWRGWRGRHGEGRSEGGIGGGGGREGGRMRRFFEQGDLRLVILGLIADAPAHGYELIRAIEERVGGAYAPSPGVVYPTLTLLEETGLIEAAATEGNKRLFQITDSGRAYLTERKTQLDELMARMDGVREERTRGDYTPVIRAMHNLRTALRLRLARGHATAETVSAVAAAIDEVAAKVDGL